VVRALAPLLLAGALVGCRATASPEVAPPVVLSAVAAQEIPTLGEDDSGYALVCGKVLTVDSEDRTFTPGLIVVRNGALAYVGPVVDTPQEYERIELPGGWAAPGLIDLHSHVQTGGWGDINDMVLPINCEFSTSPTIRPGNPNVRRACAGGVTTLFGIPGSGTNISGFGVLYKTKNTGTYESSVLADPGGMKVAQDSNPQMGWGSTRFGGTRAAMGWRLEDINDKARAALRDGRREPQLENLKKVHSKELPVLIHTAGSDGVANTAHMWRGTYDTRSVLSHGSFDGWKSAAYVAEMGMPVNNGPRTMDYYSTRDGRMVGMAHEYHQAGTPLISMNTDAGVMPQEELFLQGSMASRLGADSYLMLRAVTTHPAQAFGIEARVGSLEPGKDADIVIWNGPPLDPRARVETVMIEGKIEYDRVRDGQRF
jgi:imidazolonepropionase-like amidohydrolase